jgi:hypothetical protein
MPATQRESQGTPPGLEPALSTIYCPFCGHTGSHHGEGGIGCTDCACELSWVDIVVVHVRLHSDP